MLKSSCGAKTYKVGNKVGNGVYGDVFDIVDVENPQNDKIVAKIIKYDNIQTIV